MSRIQPHNTEAPSPTTTQNMVNTFGQPSHVSDVSQVQVVTQRKVKKKPIFCRGWLEIDNCVNGKIWWEHSSRTVMLGLRSKLTNFVCILRGKAKDVVRFGIRNSSIDVSAHPDTIYGILRKHFSITRYSTVPSADFYSTLPKNQEDPYDYWLRLNRAADFASDCLKEQGKTLDNADMEVTRMLATSPRLQN